MPLRAPPSAARLAPRITTCPCSSLLFWFDFYKRLARVFLKIFLGRRQHSMHRSGCRQEWNV